MDDRFKTMKLLNPYGHDFFLDLSGYGNLKILDIVDEAKAVNSMKVSQIEKYNNAVLFVKKYMDTEYFLKANLSVGVPLFSFWALGTKFVPDFRSDINIGSNISINYENDRLTPETILKYVNGVPDEIKDAIVARFNSYSGGDDLINDDVCTDAGIPLGATCDALKGNAFFPSDLTLPSVGAFIKADAKTGLLLNFFRRKFFGYLNLYWRLQYDFLIRKSVESIAWNGKIWDTGNTIPRKSSIGTDFKIGHQFNHFSILGMVEDVELTSMSKVSKLNENKNPVYRLHLDSKLKYSSFGLTPFVGIHKRQGYRIKEGLYGGADIGFYFWQDKISCQFRGMLDSEHFTPLWRIKLWVVLLEYSVKLPIAKKVDEIKTSTLHSLNLRVFF